MEDLVQRRQNVWGKTYDWRSFYENGIKYIISNKILLLQFTSFQKITYKYSYAMLKLPCMLNTN